MELNRLLGTRFVPGHLSNETPLARSLSQILVFHNQRNYEHRQHELTRLQFFVKHLRELETHDSKLLRHFKREIRRAGSNDSFFGVRFEVNIAASLVRKKVEFVKQEAPDFFLDEVGVAIECSSVHIRSNRQKIDYGYKITSCIHSKQKKEYANPETALFVDYTNVLQRAWSLDKEIAKATILAAYDSRSFGSVVLFHYIINRAEERIESNYVRQDHVDCANELKQFLDNHFPIGDHSMYDFSLLGEG